MPIILVLLVLFIFYYSSVIVDLIYGKFKTRSEFYLSLIPLYGFIKPLINKFKNLK